MGMSVNPGFIGTPQFPFHRRVRLPGTTLQSNYPTLPCRDPHDHARIANAVCRAGYRVRQAAVNARLQADNELGRTVRAASGPAYRLSQTYILTASRNENDACPNEYEASEKGNATSRTDCAIRRAVLRFVGLCKRAQKACRILIAKAWPTGMLQRFAFLLPLLVLTIVAPIAAHADDEEKNAPVGSQTDLNFELRVVWGGGTPRSFAGQVSVDEGSIRSVRNLSLQTDAVGTITQIEKDRLQISDTSPSAFGGADIRVIARPSALLRFQFNDPVTNKWVETTLPIAEILQGNWVRNLDDRGNRIAAERLIHDKLRLKSNEEKTVYATASNWSGTVEGYRTGLAAGEYLLQASLIDEATGGVVNKGDEKSITVNELGSFDQAFVEVSLPNAEGAYSVEIHIQKKRFLNALVSTPPALKRRIELVTFDFRANPSRIEKWTPVATVDPIASQWWTRLNWLPSFGGNSAIPQIPGLADSTRRPVSSGPQSIRKVGESSYISLQPASWQAYPLTIEHPGQPHRLRVTLPADQPQKLAISVRDFHGNGEPSALNIDTGMILSQRMIQQSIRNGQTSIEYEILFWPRSTHPYALLLNADAKMDASFGVLHLDVAELATYSPVKETLPSALDKTFSAKEKPPAEKRLVALYLNKPLIADAFGAQRSIDPQTRRPLESWMTWHQAAARLTQYLEHAGYNALILNVMSDGGTLLPSSRMTPSHRYDSATFFTDGRSPDIKDVIELLCHHFDRSNLKLILAFDFDNRLPELEKLNAAAPIEGLYQIDLDGNGWQAENQSGLRRVLYNPLSPQFQREIEQIVRQISSRYASHACFGGLAFELGANSHLMFAGDRWGYDEATLARFEASSGAKLPRGESLANVMRGAVRLHYISWRAKELSEFYERMATAIRQNKSDAKLILDPLPLWQQPPTEHDFIDPSAIARNSIDLLMATGIDSDWIKQRPTIALLRGHIENMSKESPGFDWLARLSTDPGVESAMTGNCQGTAIMEGTSPLPIEEAAKLLGASTSGSLGYIYPLFADESNGRCKRIIEQLYREDAITVADGGWMPLQGEWTELKQLRKILLALPSVPMSISSIDKGDSNIRVRTTVVNNDTYLQVINNAPWPERISMDVHVAGATGLVEVLGKPDLRLNTSASQPPSSRIKAASNIKRATLWQFDIGPYELIAIKVSDPQFRLIGFAHATDADVLTELKREIEELENRVRRIADHSPLRGLGLQGDFEQWTANQTPVGWTLSSLPGVRIDAERALPHSGQSCIMLENRNPAPVQAWIESDAIQIPNSGRMVVEAWVRASPIEASPLVRLSVQGRTKDGRGFERSQEFGRKPGGEIPADWGKRPLALHIADIPKDDLVQLKVAIDLVGSGRIWVDDVQAYETYLTPDERLRIDSQLFLAKRELPKNNAFAAEQAVASHWARYLTQLDQAQINLNAAKESNKASDSSSSPNARKANAPGPIFRQLRDTMRDKLIR